MFSSTVWKSGTISRIFQVKLDIFKSSSFLIVSHRFSLFLTMDLCVVGPVGLVGLWVWWARWSGGFCLVLTDKSPNFKGSSMPRCLWSSFYKFGNQYDSQLVIVQSVLIHKPVQSCLLTSAANLKPELNFCNKFHFLILKAFYRLPILQSKSYQQSMLF